MQYKAIGFDYGGVIGGINTVGATFTKQACELLGIDEATYKSIYFGLNHKINLGEVASWSEFWPIFLAQLGQPDKLETLVTMSAEAGKSLLVMDQAMLTLIDQLRQAGYKTGLLSNTTLEGGQNMRQQNLQAHFDAFHISAETKLMKPNPKAFSKLADDLGVHLDELIFVDDSEKSLSTASECGFTPILFRGYDDLVLRLRDLGISYR